MKKGIHLLDGEQILRTCEDHAPVRVQRDQETADSNRIFRIADGAECSWAKADEAFGPQKLRPRIEPWLTALVQSEHLSLLIGSGLTHAVHRMATDSSLSGMGSVDFDVLNDEIRCEAKRASKAAGREEGNLEDQIRIANELLRGLEILAAGKPPEREGYHRMRDLRAGLRNALTFFAEDILKCEHRIATSTTEKREHAFNYLVSFLMSFASRTGPRERL